MNSFFKTFLIILLPFSVKSQSIERQVIASTGNFAQNTEGSLAFTVGEPTIVLGSSATNFLTQGFQQPVAIIRTGIVVVASKNPCEFSISPNPTHGVLNFQSSSNIQTSFEVFDLVGKSFGKYKTSNGLIDVVNLSAGTYLLRSDCDGSNAFAQKFIKL